MDVVCLKCGDIGFPEALVFCNECQAYALHRYCLDGPVILTGDVTWFCDDCKANVVELSSLDHSTPPTSIISDSIELESGVTRELKNCISGVKKSNQEQQKIIEVDVGSVQLVCHVNAQPVFDTIWRGSLNFFSKETTGIVTGVVAHMSSLACSKVFEETVLFPKVLCADLLPRSSVWPKSFKNGGPTDQSIALYFFPEGESAEKVYDQLIEDVIRLDLGLRVVAENAELLIFSSTRLPIQHWRFKAKYYLWGVFRGKQSS